MAHTETPTDLGALVRCEAVAPSFRQRTYAAGRNAYGDLNLIAVTTQGRARLLLDDTGHDIGTDCILVLPHGMPGKIVVEAGARVWMIGFARSLQPMVTGAGTEGLKLDRILSHLTLTPADPEATRGTVLPLLPMLEAEIVDPARRSHVAVAALLRLILIATARMLRTEDAVGHQPETAILHRFRQLVELGYRDRRGLADYCHDLNLSYDRLHDICQRLLGRTPLTLVHQRVLLDATTRLAQTDDTVSRIADQLGFDEPTQFSHFFKRATGMSPRRFRQDARQSGTRKTDTAGLSFADWP
ncbi:helix-turn-helix domain-containing protein [Phaeovulum sp. W22_SRMD_FR3]|uniref:helix-turn-helix domain-containing protein n=1 Tax=Phaeovulum sp. W22_SRMD_FR3 TaxID=3240274 RepID=UPI003F9A91A9